MYGVIHKEIVVVQIGTGKTDIKAAEGQERTPNLIEYSLSI